MPPDDGNSPKRHARGEAGEGAILSKKQRKERGGQVGGRGGGSRPRDNAIRGQRYGRRGRGGPSNRQHHQQQKRAPSDSNVPSLIERASSFASSVDISSSSPTLSWHSPHSHVQIEAEESLLPLVLKYQKRENGMFRKKPAWLIDRVQRSCSYCGMELIQALSLRRTHIKFLNKYKGMEELGLGGTDDVRAAAALFENAVEAYLSAEGVPFISEEEQKRIHKSKKGAGPMPPTPDFILKEPTRLQYTAGTKQANATPTVCWIEAKMFYGASTIPEGSQNAVGLIMPKMRKYVELYGPGVIVFSFGCGERLAQHLASIGVVALDAHPLDLSEMEEQQRTWCADDQGRILP
mmetsp:Transcript_36121/g.79065  ORF Transcript_36121/g.79065 Transcript_36121/m.79065 type:complete len:349 (+) Transcript_36121:30-1076(+)